MATDEELVEQLRHGKQEAYEELFHRYYDRIYAICFSMLRVH